MDRLHVELIATRPLDFRDAPRFAATCTAARSAILSGPLHLWTDIERIITVAQLERLLHLLAWCGQAVRSLRLDQQPRVLWAKDAIARVERAGTDDTTDVRRDAQEKAMEQMPWASVRVLQAIRRCCPSLEELAFHGWVAYGGSDTRWAASLSGELAQLPRLRRVRLPSGLAHSIEELLERCPQLSQIDVGVCSPESTLDGGLGRTSTPASPVVQLLESRHAARLQQLRLYGVGGELALLRRSTPRLRRVHLRFCNLPPLELTALLPEGLMVLTLDDCDASCVPPSPAERLRVHLRQLQHFDAGEAWRAASLANRVGLLEALVTLPRLRVLEVSGVPGLSDAMVHQLVASCPLLHTLGLAYSEVSACGFEALLDPVALPQLRVLQYCNSSYECGVRPYLTMSVEEIERECEEALLEAQLHGLSLGVGPAMDLEDLKDAWRAQAASIAHTQAWFAYAAVHVTRRFALPPPHEPMDCRMPCDQHPITRDYFRLSCDV
eukprot:scaffold36071_cov74-Phaeocystis_antarctica.AAC.5